MRLICSSLGLIFALGLVPTSPAAAKGTVRVQQANGSVSVYSGVSIRVANKTLRVTSADGKGTLIIDKAACFSDGQLERCLPYSIQLSQNGKTHPLDFKTGTVYVNLTATKQQLPMSSTQIPPKGILMALQTKIGTYVSLSGTIDEMKR
jgi:hypothetical protein